MPRGPSFPSGAQNLWDKMTVNAMCLSWAVKANDLVRLHHILQLKEGDSFQIFQKID